MGTPPSDSPIRFAKAVPSLPVENCEAAIRYYVDVLGFELDYDDEILGHEATLFAGLSRDECEITLNQHDEQRCRLTIGCDVDDVDRLYEELLARGAKITLEPRDEPWGQRHMAVADLDGHELHFSSE